MGEDLEAGFDVFRKHEEVDEHLDSLLESLMKYEQEKEKRVDVDIVTWRGMLTKIMTVRVLPFIPYSSRVFGLGGDLW